MFKSNTILFVVSILLQWNLLNYQVIATNNNFLAADFGQFPPCQVYGRTYCIHIDQYPEKRIRHLLENRLFNLSSLMISEGNPEAIEENEEEKNSVKTSDEHYRKFVEDYSINNQSRIVVDSTTFPDPEIELLKNNDSIRLTTEKEKKNDSVLKSIQELKGLKEVFVPANNFLADSSEIASADFEPPNPPRSHSFNSFLAVDESNHKVYAVKNKNPFQQKYGLKKFTNSQFLNTDSIENPEEQDLSIDIAEIENPKSDENLELNVYSLNKDKNSAEKKQISATVVEIRKSINEKNELKPTIKPHVQDLLKIINSKKRRKYQTTEEPDITTFRAIPTIVNRETTTTFEIPEDITTTITSTQSTITTTFRSTTKPRLHIITTIPSSSNFPIEYSKPTTLTTPPGLEVNQKFLDESKLQASSNRRFDQEEEDEEEFLINSPNNAKKPQLTDAYKLKLKRKLAQLIRMHHLQKTKEHQHQIRAEEKFPIYNNNNNYDDDDKVKTATLRNIASTNGHQQISAQSRIGIESRDYETTTSFVEKNFKHFKPLTTQPPEFFQFKPIINPKYKLVFNDAQNNPFIQALNNETTTQTHFSKTNEEPEQLAVKIIAVDKFSNPQQVEKIEKPFYENLKYKPELDDIVNYQEAPAKIATKKTTPATPADIVKGKPMNFNNPIGPIPQKSKRPNIGPKRRPPHIRRFKGHPNPSGSQQRRLPSFPPSTTSAPSFFQSLFSRRRSKRDIESSCEAKSTYIFPKVAFSVKGQWLFIVNLPGDSEYQQGVHTVDCRPGICHKCRVEKGQCDFKFVQKRLIALDASGQRLINEIFWLPSECQCS